MKILYKIIWKPIFYLLLACEAQTHFQSSLLSLLFFGGREATTGNASALRRNYYLPNLKMHKPTGRFDLFDTILAWDQAQQWGKRQKTGWKRIFFSFFPQCGAWSRQLFFVSSQDRSIAWQHKEQLWSRLRPSQDYLILTCNINTTYKTFSPLQIVLFALSCILPQCSGGSLRDRLKGHQPRSD